MSGVSRSNRQARVAVVSRIRPATDTAWERVAFVLGVLLFILSVAFVRTMMGAEPIVHGFDARQSGAVETVTVSANS
jgi:hypothetical protein